MSDAKIIKIKYLINSEQIIEDYVSDGYDQINGVLEYIADQHIPIDAQPRDIPRPVKSKRNLYEHGISDIYVMYEDSDWLPLKDSDLLSV
ncbi:hypothetical protein ACTZGI_02780 [Rahnella aceris]|uniref:hypothetical protein n=1 Tax=Rahnella sp. (strain Y9602) TaxID=2703885 RepID=UPI003FD01F3E